jgi:hypothetical protein
MMSDSRSWNAPHSAVVEPSEEGGAQVATMTSVQVFDKDKWRPLQETEEFAKEFATTSSMLVNRQTQQLVAISEEDNYDALFDAFREKFRDEDELNYVAMPGPAALSNAAKILSSNRDKTSPNR